MSSRYRIFKLLYSATGPLAYAAILHQWTVAGASPELRDWSGTLLITMVVCLQIPMLLGAFVIPRAMFKLRGFEESGRLYEILGIRQFEFLLPADGIWMRRQIRQRDPSILPPTTRASLRKWWIGGLSAECIHWGLIAFTIPPFYWAWESGNLGLIWFIMLSHIPINLYPIMMQRYNRGRILRLCRRRGLDLSHPSFDPA